MNLAYKPLLELNFGHDYFPAGKCGVLELVPTPSTQEILRLARVRMVRREFGYEFFYGKVGERKPDVLMMEEPLNLHFWLRTTDANFYNYSDLSFSDPGQEGYYFSNEGTAAEAGKAKRMSATDAERLTRRRSVFIHVLPEGELPKLEDISVEDDRGNLVHPPGVPPVVLPADEPQNPPTVADRSFTVDLSDQPSGRYILKHQDNPVLSFFGGAHPLPRVAMGMVNLQLGLPVESEGGVALLGVTSPLAFSLDFRSKGTKWRYFVVNRSNTDFSSFRVEKEEEDERSEVNFTLAEEVAPLPNGDVPTVMEADREINFRSVYPHNFKLVMERPLKGNGRKVASTISLPNASPDQIYYKEISREDGSTFKEYNYSNVYIYL